MMVPLFRVFDIQRREYHSSGSIFLEIPARGEVPKTIVHLGETDLPDRYRDRFEFEPWLGCVDSAGTRVFLGDVVKDEMGNFGAIVWNQDDASFCVLFPGFECQPLEETSSWATIVGTVHDAAYRGLLSGEAD